MPRHLPLLLRLLPAIAAAVLFAGLPPAASAAPYVLSGFPLLRQQHSLTCEASAASMGTRGVISETQIMTALPRDPNPNFGFRGNPNGYARGELADYGVYANPVHRALLSYGYASDVITYGSDTQIAGYLTRGWPVVVWVTYQLQRAQPRLVQRDGVQFILVPHEHALLVVGYGAQTVVANDPWTAKRVRYSWAQFNRSWGYFGNMALAIAPCPMAQPVTSIRQSALSMAQVRWSWSPAANAVRYRVQVVLRGKPNVVVYQQDQTTRHVTVMNPKAGAEYDVSVEAVSACGVASSPTQLSTLLPAVLPTVTPTPTIPPRPTSTPTSTPTGTAAPASPTSTGTPV
jgi:uncharacterized protein YvpB